MNYIEAINLLSQYCGPRDIEDLSPYSLKKNFQIEQADVLVLFGGSILAGADEFADARRQQIAKNYIIVGGVGHTTDGLRSQVKMELPQLPIDNLSEAEIFNAYLQTKYDVKADFLET